MLALLLTIPFVCLVCVWVCVCPKRMFMHTQVLVVEEFICMSTHSGVGACVFACACMYVSCLYSSFVQVCL